MLLSFLLFIGFHTAASAVENKDFWYKVESKEEKEEVKDTTPEYHFDSIESRATGRRHRTVLFWGRKPTLGLGGGFLFDRTFIEDEHSQPWGANVDITFKDRGWNRFLLGGLFTFRSHMVLNAIWQFTPSRKARRMFYGLGLSLDWDARSEIRTIVELKNYWIVASFGYEFLLPKGQALRGEFRAYGGTESYAGLLLFSYIWSL